MKKNSFKKQTLLVTHKKCSFDCHGNYLYLCSLMRKEANMQDEKDKPKEINHKIVDLQVLQIFGFDGKLHYSQC